MSAFSEHFQQFTSRAWSNQVEISLTNELIQHRQEILENQMDGPTYVKNFIDANAALISQTSRDFQDEINKLPQLMTEGIVKRILEDDGYHGVWDETAILIMDRKHRKLNPDVIKAIKTLALNDYRVRVIPNNEHPERELLVKKIKLSHIGNFKADIQDINKDLITKSIVLPEKSYNIANKVNREMQQKHNREERLKAQLPQFESKEIRMENKNILNEAKSKLTKVGYSFNETSLAVFVKENEDKVKSLVESNDALDAHRLYALFEANQLKEMDTADINVPEAAAFGVMKKRLESFNPYGNAQNAVDGSKVKVKFDNVDLKESLRGVNVKKMTVLASDVDEINKTSTVLYECDGKKSEIEIDRQDFIKYVKRNSDTSNYMTEGAVNMKAYMGSRTYGFVNDLFKSYFVSKLNENMGGDLDIEEVRIDTNKDTVEIHYYYPSDEETKIFDASLEDLKSYLQSIDHNWDDYNRKDGGESEKEAWHDFDEYWNQLETVVKKRYLKNFLNSKGVARNNSKTQITEAAVSTAVQDYNGWKAELATRTKNMFDIKKKNDNVSEATDKKGNKIGEWNSNKSIGLIYK